MADLMLIWSIGMTISIHQNAENYSVPNFPFDQASTVPHSERIAAITSRVVAQY
jgi:hypothetical protein